MTKPKNNKKQIKPDETAIIRLINSIYYFFEYVYIRRLPEGNYRLVVLHNRRVECQRDYGTVRGAKVAFEKLNRWKKYRPYVRPVWSKLYFAENDWEGFRYE